MTEGACRERDAATSAHQRKGLALKKVCVELSLQVGHLDTNNLDELGREVLGQERVRAPKNELHIEGQDASTGTPPRGRASLDTFHSPG